MIDLLDETQKPTTVFERYILASQHHTQMEESYTRMAEEANDMYLPETAKYWREHCLKQAARHKLDAEEWKAMAEHWRDKK